MPPLPADERLAVVARALEEVQLLGELRDRRWNVVYITSELRAMMGDPTDEELGIGATVVQRTDRHPEVWSVARKGRRTWFEQELPFIRFDLPDREEALEKAFGDLAERAAAVEPAVPHPAWSGHFEWVRSGDLPLPVHRFNVRLESEGEPIGVLTLYMTALPGRLVAMLSRGDPGMYLRMAKLSEPRRRPAAILFADLEASGVIARRLSTTAYFDLIREITTRIDEAVIEHQGVVGKHAGDGVSAFFIGEQCGSEAEAARSALEAAEQVRSVPSALTRASEGLMLNVGVHWGATLVIGQVVTGGRLEVTALGDEVNQAARIQQSAHGGRLLASKDLVERLDQADAFDLGIDPIGATYTPLEQLPDVGEKARRDAGNVPVIAIEAH
jgi:class 3 adenylate cyclase